MCGVLQASAGEVSASLDNTARRRRPEQAVSSTWDTQGLTTAKRTEVDEFDGAIAATTDNVHNPSACELCKFYAGRSRRDVSCLVLPTPSEPSVAVCWSWVMAFLRTTRSAWS